MNQLNSIERDLNEAVMEVKPEQECRCPDIVTVGVSNNRTNDGFSIWACFWVKPNSQPSHGSTTGKLLNQKKKKKKGEKFAVTFWTLHDDLFLKNGRKVVKKTLEESYSHID